MKISFCNNIGWIQAFYSSHNSTNSNNITINHTTSYNHYHHITNMTIYNQIYHHFFLLWLPMSNLSHRQGLVISCCSNSQRPKSTAASNWEWCCLCGRESRIHGCLRVRPTSTAVWHSERWLWRWSIRRTMQSGGARPLVWRGLFGWNPWFVSWIATAVPCCKWRMFFMFHTSKLSIYPDILTDLLFGFIWQYLAHFLTFYPTYILTFYSL